MKVRIELTVNIDPEGWVAANGLTTVVDIPSDVREFVEDLVQCRLREMEVLIEN